MSSLCTQLTRILAIVPHSKGLGYAVFESITAPIDWGIKRVTGEKNQATIEKVETLIVAYQPDAIVVEEIEGSRRCERIKTLLYAIIERAQSLGIEVATYSRQTVAAFFDPDATLTKHEIATVIANRFPALRPRLPGPRKPWQSEDYRMSIFEACGLCLVWLTKRPA